MTETDGVSLAFKSDCRVEVDAAEGDGCWRVAKMPGPTKTPQFSRLLRRRPARHSARIVNENARSARPAPRAVYGASLANLLRREAIEG